MPKNRMGTEKNSQPQGKSGSKVKTLNGPATGKGDRGQKATGRSAKIK